MSRIRLSVKLALLRKIALLWFGLTLGSITSLDAITSSSFARIVNCASALKHAFDR